MTRSALVRALLFVAILTVGSAPVSAQEAATGPARFADEIKAFAEWDSKNAAPQDSTLFVGSSTIRLWPTADRFPGLPVVNRGFGGSQIPDVNHYLQETVLKYRPAVVVFYAGDNDINAGRTPQQVLDDFRTFAQRIHAARSDTRIIYLPIKPSVARWALWPTMRAANDRVRGYITGLFGSDPRQSARLSMPMSPHRCSRPVARRNHIYMSRTGFT